MLFVRTGKFSVRVTKTSLRRSVSCTHDLSFLLYHIAQLSETTVKPKVSKRYNSVEKFSNARAYDIEILCSSFLDVNLSSKQIKFICETKLRIVNISL